MGKGMDKCEEENYTMNEGQGLGLKEIDLLDLMSYCLGKWRVIVVFMIFFAVITGGYKYHNIMKGNQPVQKERISTEEEDDSYESIMNEKERDVKQKKDYLDSSIVMQINPYCVSEGSLSYYIECEGDKENLIATYVAYILGGKMLEDLSVEDTDVPVEDLQYLISCIKSSNSKGKDSILTDNGEIQTDSAVLVIQIKMPNRDLCEIYVRRVEELMMEYSSRLQREMKEHKLTLLTSAQLELTDLDIQDYQSNMLNAYLSAIDSLQTLQTLHTEPETVSDIQDEKDAFVASANVLPLILKHSVLGLILGACLSCLVLSILYLFGGKLQNIECFQFQYGMPLLGVVRTSGRKSKLFGFIDSWVFRLRGGVYAKISLEEQIKMAVVNVQAMITKNFRDEGVRKIMLAGTVSDKDAVELCDFLTSEISTAVLSPYKRIIFQSSDLKELESYAGIVFVERQEQSCSELILREKNLASDRDVKVLGTIVVC